MDKEEKTKVECNRVFVVCRMHIFPIDRTQERRCMSNTIMDNVDLCSHYIRWQWKKNVWVKKGGTSCNLLSSFPPYWRGQKEKLSTNQPTRGELTVIEDDKTSVKGCDERGGRWQRRKRKCENRVERTEGEMKWLDRGLLRDGRQ